jgi:glycerophosphoryl diester phosphodiesterase
MPASAYAFFQNAGPLAFAHRGGAACWPENTLESFRGALAAGCRYLETDLRTSKDGAIVLFHDENLERTTNGYGKVADHTLAELKRLDAGYRFSPDGVSFPARGRGLEIPTFAELVAVATEARFNVEIKQRQPKMVRAVWDFIQAHSLVERVLVAAEQDVLVREFRRVSGGRVATSAGHDECLRFWLASRLGLARWLRPSYQALQIPEYAGRWQLVTPGLLAAARRLGIEVHVWTINESEDMRRLLRLGVGGLMSDYPERLVAAVGALGQ